MDASHTPRGRENEMVVIVKGDGIDAALAAAARGIPAAYVREFREPAQTMISVPDNYADVVAAWFVEDSGDFPYQLGSCLWYS